ncbi:MAG: GNAT family N-acetyltransferase [Gammaproteobacteria bacterium]|nr:GNAT family N-acetyltransferase [Gammaproteobacteria bacterium]
MHEISPPGTMHALPPEALRHPDITFWSGWDNDNLVGCGALKQLDEHTGEIKSMRTAGGYSGKGFGSKMLEHIIDHARRRGYRTLLLETGRAAGFQHAWSLYLNYGFEYCGPFADYREEPDSVFMMKRL